MKPPPGICRAREVWVAQGRGTTADGSPGGSSLLWSSGALHRWWLSPSSVVAPRCQWGALVLAADSPLVVLPRCWSLPVSIGGSLSPLVAPRVIEGSPVPVVVPLVVPHWPHSPPPSSLWSMLPRPCLACGGVLPVLAGAHPADS